MTEAAKRGDAAHQANTSSNPSCTPHLVKRDELEKAIRFLKGDRRRLLMARENGLD